MADVSQIKLPNGSVYDLIDEKSGYITAEYIENKTDYEIPVSRVGEIVVGETAIGTDSTNFPTSKAVVDYVDERVVQEIDAIDVGVISVNGKTGSVTLSASDLDNDMGFITSDSDEKLVTNTVVDRNTTYHPILGEYDTTASTKVVSSNFFFNETPNSTFLGLKKNGVIYFYTYNNNNRYTTLSAKTQTDNRSIKLPDASGTVALTTDIPSIPTNISSFTNDSGYLTASDIASVMTYKGTKANYAALPSTGNTTGDVWHLTDTGAEWAWDGSAWQELGTAIDLSNYLTTSDIAAWAKASTKPTYTAAEVGALPDSTVIPSKTSDLTNDSGFITSYTDEKLAITQVVNNSSYYPIFGSGSTAATRLYDNNLTYTTESNRIILALGASNNKKGIIQIYSKNGTGSTQLSTDNTSGVTLVSLPNKGGTIALTDDIPTVPTKVSDLTNDSGFLTSYTETDPVFSASAAAGITSTDISNWNAKVSDTGKWNGVELANFETATANDYYVPAKTTVGSTSGTASWLKVTRTPGNYSIAQYDNGYLKSTTPSANDNSTKVATTAYVDAAIPDTSGFVSKSGDTMSGRLTLNCADGTNVNNRGLLFDYGDTYKALLTIDGGTYTGSQAIARLIFDTVGTTNGVILRGIATPDIDTAAANKKYVDNAIPKVYSSTNTGGYLTMATLPIYDGTVV